MTNQNEYAKIITVTDVIYFVTSWHIKTQRLIQKSLRFLFCLKRLNCVVFRIQINGRGELYRLFVQKNKNNETVAEYKETIAPMVAFFKGGCIVSVSLEFAVSLLKTTKNRGTLKQKSGCPIFSNSNFRPVLFTFCADYYTVNISAMGKEIPNWKIFQWNIE